MCICRLRQHSLLPDVWQPHEGNQYGPLHQVWQVTLTLPSHSPYPHPTLALTLTLTLTQALTLAPRDPSRSLDLILLCTAASMILLRHTGIQRKAVASPASREESSSTNVSTQSRRNSATAPSYLSDRPKSRSKSRRGSSDRYQLCCSNHCVHCCTFCSLSLTSCC